MTILSIVSVSELCLPLYIYLLIRVLVVAIKTSKQARDFEYQYLNERKKKETLEIIVSTSQ